MTFFAIIVATLAAGIGSVWLAALLSFAMMGRFTQHLLSMAAGALLATAFLNLLPEAFESKVNPETLFATLLVGLVFFFLLDKAELWHHGHEHHHEAPGRDPAHDHEHARGSGAHAHQPPMSGGWAVLAGDSIHCFGDGILIASAFMADMRLGIIAALAVLAHEVPHHMGDLMVLRMTTGNRRAALIKVSLAGSVTALGGVVGAWLVDMLHGSLPYFLVIASSSFVYVALADLIPQLQRRLSARETIAQITWLSVGIGLVLVVSALTHGQH
ncbi:MAG: ZIP family metal transporter [Burkholderiaceae bacterium]|nr:ZIP family metal transporter [Burkholderiaceae bacterium]MDO9089870.1 ZIP family metal transporter [Burkholderiaceae bacterium]